MEDKIEELKLSRERTVVISMRKYHDWEAFMAGIKLMDDGMYFDGKDIIPRCKITFDHVLRELIDKDLYHPRRL